MAEKIEPKSEIEVPNTIKFPQDWAFQRMIDVKRDMPSADFQRMMKSAKDPNRQRGLVFENEKQRNAMAIRKGLTKPGRIGYDTLRRIGMSVYVARICINALKAKVTKTKWVIQPIDQGKRKKAKESDKRIKELEDFFKHPNLNDETFRTLMDKMCEDLLVLDAVSVEKTRYPDGTLAELHFVDSATIRPVYDEHGNQDVIIKLATKAGEEELPVSYLQILNNSQYGGPESGDIVAAWPKKDFIHFHMNPQGSMESFGYGLSPLEGVLSVVSNLLNSDNYNSTYFEEGAFPPVILNIVGQISQRDLEAFKEYFHQEISGNFHRPAVMASQTKSEVINLKDFTNRDMQFMEYTMWLAKMLCAAYGMSPEDIGITDTTGSKSVSEVQKTISEDKGYTSLLDLFKQVFNQEIIWKDFGYEDLEFDWVAMDDVNEKDGADIDDKALRNGTKTLNEVRLARGDTPYESWADEPMFLSADGYKPILAADNPEGDEGGGEDDKIIGGEKPYKDQDKKDTKGEKITKMQKAVFTQFGYKTWADDRGVSHPFIYCDIKNGFGKVIKPPLAVNLKSQNLEISLSHELRALGVNVPLVEKMTYVEVTDMLRNNYPDVAFEFEKYCNMTPEYDSERYRAKYGGSHKWAYYLVSDYIEGHDLKNPLLIADMKRDPESYKDAIHDLAQLWKVEKELLLGDRRADQYIIGHDKRAYGIDYQFKGDKERWERNKDVLTETLDPIPELKSLFDAATQDEGFSLKAIFKALLNKKPRGSV